MNRELRDHMRLEDVARFNARCGEEPEDREDGDLLFFGVEDAALSDANAHEFVDQDEEFCVSARFRIYVNPQARRRCLAVHVDFLPGLDGRTEGSCALAATYDERTRRVVDTYAHGQNVNEYKIPELMKIYLRHMENPAAYAPFIDLLCDEWCIDTEMPEHEHSNPN